MSGAVSVHNCIGDSINTNDYAIKNLIRQRLNTTDEIKEQMFGTTVVQKLNQGTLPGLGCNQSRVPFLGTFLGMQKGIDTLFDNPQFK